MVVNDSSELLGYKDIFLGPFNKATQLPNWIHLI